MVRIAVLALVVACSSSAPPATKPTPPTQDTAMSDTSSIYPADQLLAWLEKHKSDRMAFGNEIELKLPVVVTLSDNKMNVETARVGDKADGLAITVNDSTMNIPLAGKLPMFFGEGATTGMLWLNGYWRGGQNKEFQVTTAAGAIEAGDRAGATKAEILK
jgi:hypothetical protein